MDSTVKECMMQCDPNKMLVAYLCCFGKDVHPIPTKNEIKGFQNLLNAVNRVEPIQTGSTLCVKTVADSLDITMVDSQQQESSLLLMEWAEVLGLTIHIADTDQFEEERVMAAVLYEMTWFGLTAETVRREREMTLSCIEECD